MEMLAPWTWALHLLSIYVLVSFAHCVWSTLCYFNILIMWYKGWLLDLNTSKELDSSPALALCCQWHCGLLTPLAFCFLTPKRTESCSRGRELMWITGGTLIHARAPWTVAPDKIWETIIIAPYALQVFCNETLPNSNLWCLFTCQGMSSLVLCFLFCSHLPILHPPLL